MTNLRLQSQRCEFCDTTEVQQRLTEQLVIGVHDPIVQDFMLSQDKSMSLESVIYHVRIHEADIASFLQPQSRATVNLVTRKHNSPRRNNTPHHASPHTYSVCHTLHTHPLHIHPLHTHPLHTHPLHTHPNTPVQLHVPTLLPLTNLVISPAFRYRN